MFDLSPYIDVPLVWYGLIATAIFIYVLLDGFDLGVGILFPFAPSDESRDKMMGSIAPFWDGNETWLVLSGGGLLAAFPLAYAILMPAFYAPIILMLLGLILRGVSFEFRFKSSGRMITLWNYVFHFGSLAAAFCQGTILGAFIQGVRVNGTLFSGSPLDWLSAFSVMTGVALVCGYGLLGATWLIMKTEAETQAWARRWAHYLMGYVAFFMVLVTLSMPYLSERIKLLWFSLPYFIFLKPLPLLATVMFIVLWRDLRRENEYRPFLLSLGIFLTNYLGLIASMWPWVVPFEITFRRAAAAPESQSLLLVGTLVMLPIILSYTAYSYYVFRGKSAHEETY